MSYNGSGTFQINTSGQPVVAGTVISATAFNALTADLATGLSTAITKDGQTTTTARIIFAQGTRDNTLTASSAVATDASKNLVSVTNTGTGNNVLATSPTLVTPNLGTPTSGILTNCTGINYDGFKNRIINGAMVIDQRNAGALVTSVGNGVYTLDRFIYYHDVGTLNVQKNLNTVTPPAGFANYYGLTVTGIASPSAANFNSLQHLIEGFNIADLAWGTASASSVTLSFWVRSSVTGTFSGAFLNSAGNYGYGFTYSIPTANTWTLITVNVAGPTAGAWDITNGRGIAVIWDLGNGSNIRSSAGSWQAANVQGVTGAVNLFATNGATFYITGVQLEKGSTATSFDYRPYGTELQLCQRYYQQYGGDDTFAPVASLGIASGSVDVKYIFVFPVQMRATPSVAQSTLQLVDGATSYTVTGISQGANEQSRKACNINFSVASGLTQFRPYWVRTNNNASGYLAISAEL